MLEELRQQAVNTNFFDLSDEEEEAPIEEFRAVRRRSDGKFLGMNAVQRFVISLMLFVLTFLIGSLTLLVTEKVVLPFL